MSDGRSLAQAGSLWYKHLVLCTARLRRQTTADHSPPSSTVHCSKVSACLSAKWGLLHPNSNLRLPRPPARASTLKHLNQSSLSVAAYSQLFTSF